MFLSACDGFEAKSLICLSGTQVPFSYLETDGEVASMKIPSRAVERSLGHEKAQP